MMCLIKSTPGLTISSKSPSQPFIFIFYPTEFNSCCQYMHKHRAIQGNMDNLPWATSLKTDYLSIPKLSIDNGS